MRSYFKLSKKEKGLFREALWIVYITKLQLIFYSFNKYSKKLVSTGKIDDPPKEELQLIGIAIYRTRWLAFWKNKCLVNTLAARKMLNKRNIHSVAHLTLKKDNQERVLKAHAWIHSNGVSIVLPEEGYSKVYSF